MSPLATSRAAISLIRLSRPHNLVITLLGVVVGASIAEPGVFRSVQGLLIASAPPILVAAGGYIVNDYYDIDIDRRSKPWRPLAKGDIEPAHALIASIVFMILGFLAALLISSPLLALFVAVNAILTYAYSWRLKRTGFLGNICVSILSANSILYGGLFYAMESSRNPQWFFEIAVPWVYAFAMSLSREIVKGIEDIAGDSVHGVKTLAVSRGYRYASLTASLILAFLLSIVWIPIMIRYSIAYLALAIISTTIFLVSAIRITISRDISTAVRIASSARSISKLSLLLGTIAFLAWALQ